jgi:TRAP-type mannitol/chloroaromatic compound transport system substrate-binding protein
MERRTLLKSAGAGLVAASSMIAAPAIAQGAPVIKWRCTSSFPKSLDTIYGGAEVLASVVSDLTGGNFQISVFAPGEIVPGLQAMDAVSNATVECAHTCGYYYVGKDPTFALGTAVPFGPNARQMNAWLYAGGGNELLDEFHAKYHFRAFPAGNTGVQMGGWFRKEITRLDDLSGLKMRIAGLAGQVMAKLGVVPQQLAGSDIYPSLEKGVIDAAEWVGPYDDLKLGFNKVAPYYYFPGWWEGGPTVHLYVNSDKYAELPPAYQKAIQAGAHVANTTMLAKYDALNPRALRELVAQHTQLKPFPRDVMEAAYKAAQDLYAGLYQSNADFKKIHEAQSAFRNDDIVWFSYGEYPYDQFMKYEQSRG